MGAVDHLIRILLVIAAFSAAGFVYGMLFEAGLKGVAQ